MTKCKKCKKKCPLIYFSCKCNNIYCLTCLLPENHNCSFDYITENKSKLTNSLEKIENKKINII